jgi:hypothetical protein
MGISNIYESRKTDVPSKQLDLLQMNYCPFIE